MISDAEANRLRRELAEVQGAENKRLREELRDAQKRIAQLEKPFLVEVEGAFIDLLKIRMVQMDKKPYGAGQEMTDRCRVSLVTDKFGEDHIFTFWGMSALKIRKWCHRYSVGVKFEDGKDGGE